MWTHIGPIWVRCRHCHIPAGKPRWDTYGLAHVGRPTWGQYVPYRRRPMTREDFIWASPCGQAQMGPILVMPAQARDLYGLYLGLPIWACPHGINMCPICAGPNGSAHTGPIGSLTGSKHLKIIQYVRFLEKYKQKKRPFCLSYKWQYTTYVALATNW